jgi:hypothetical protein
MPRASLNCVPCNPIPHLRSRFGSVMELSGWGPASGTSAMTTPAGPTGVHIWPQPPAEGGFWPRPDEELVADLAMPPHSSPTFQSGRSTSSTPTSWQEGGARSPRSASVLRGGCDSASDTLMHRQAPAPAPARARHRRTRTDHHQHVPCASTHTIHAASVVYACLARLVRSRQASSLGVWVCLGVRACEYGARCLMRACTGRCVRAGGCV